MKNKIILTCTLFAFVFSAAAQWPGNFYAFELHDSANKSITSENKNCVFKIVTDSGVVMNVDVCEDKKTWRFYEGGNHYMGSTQKLKVEKIQNTKTIAVMIIEFPPTISGGKEPYYRNLYTGTLFFKKGVYKIKLPKTDEQWDNLKEVNICPDNFNSVYFDISEFQE